MFAAFDDFLANHKLSDLIKDDTGKLSYGKMGGIGCLFVAFGAIFSGFIAATVILFVPSCLNNPNSAAILDKILNYSTTISLQFLGAAFTLYLPGKVSAAYIAKWAPGVAMAFHKADTAAEAVVAEKKEANKDSDKDACV